MAAVAARSRTKVYQRASTFAAAQMLPHSGRYFLAAAWTRPAAAAPFPAAPAAPIRSAAPAGAPCFVIAAAAAAPLPAPPAAAGRFKLPVDNDVVSADPSSLEPRRLPRWVVYQQVFSRSLSNSRIRKIRSGRDSRFVDEHHNAPRSNSTGHTGSGSHGLSRRNRADLQSSSSCIVCVCGRGSLPCIRNVCACGCSLPKLLNVCSANRNLDCVCGINCCSRSSTSPLPSKACSASLLPTGDACSRSSCSSNGLLRCRKEEQVPLFGESALSRNLPCCASVSFFFSSCSIAAPLEASRSFVDVVLHNSSSGRFPLWLLQPRHLAAADNLRRPYSSLPLGRNGSNSNRSNSNSSSSRDGTSMSSRCFALSKLPAATSEDGRHASSEGRPSTGWAKTAAALLVATGAAATLGGGADLSNSRLSLEQYYTRPVLCSCPPSSSSSSSPTPSLPSTSSSSSSSHGSRGSRASLLLFEPHASSGVTASLSPQSAVRGGSFARSPPSRCCGIVGYVGDREALPLLLDGLEILQNRGYDSCGISSVSEGGGALVTTKYASRGSTCDSLSILREQAQQAHAGNRIGIGHTRWATHGSKTDANAHPHHDWKDRVSVVHNGTIDNFAALKQALQRRGCTFRSETDSEVIANLIGWHLDNGAGFEESVKNALGEIQGTWGLCVLHKDYPDRLVLARNGSPLLVGAAAGGQVFVASEPAALAQHTNQYLMLKDGEIAVITAEGVGQLEASRPMHSIGIEEQIELSPHPFPHWTVKEIYEQPQALARAMNYGGRIAPYRSAVKLGGLDQSRESLLAIKNLLICGCGTSLYAGMYGELIMQWLGCLHQVRAVDASELELHAFPKEDAGVLLLSQSGETLDTVRACQLAEINGIKKFSVVNQVGSLLARLTDCGVYVNAGREVAVASTKAFSCQVTVLSLIAAWFFQNKSQHPVSQQHADRCAALMDAIQRLPVYAGMTLNCRDACASVATKLLDAKTVFVLGKGFGYPVALEGALKIKEVGCIHAEGFPGGALKHGPFALIDEAERTPVVMLLLSDQHAAYMLNAAQQVKARGAHLVCITDVPEAVKGVADDLLVVPSNGPLTALLACIPLQLLAYELAVAKGINPDKPRGLAKTVTVF